MSTNVIPFPTKGNLADEKHARLRRFFDLVAEAASECEVIAYTAVALHAPDPDSDSGCVHGDVMGLADSIDAEWVEEAIDNMGAVAHHLWDAVAQRVKQNIEDHDASDAAKADKDDE